VKLSVVIPALDEAAEIVGAIESASAPGVEILVADGGSGDDTRERASAAGARVVVSPPGRSRQLESGARAARGDVLLFLHADTRLPPGFAAGVDAALADERVVGGAFRLRFDRRSAALRLVEWGVRLRVALFRLPYGDQALFVRRSVLDRIGGIPQVAIMEDLDLVRSMRRQGGMELLPLVATTSARRYRRHGPICTALRNGAAAAAWALGLDRERIAGWYAR
jgi:rSAM/selenodomain-associated transferase 2